MAAQRLSIPPAIATAYRNLWRALLAMRALFVIALLIVLAIKVAEGFVPLRLWNGQYPAYSWVSLWVQFRFFPSRHS